MDAATSTTVWADIKPNAIASGSTGSSAPYADTICEASLYEEKVAAKVETLPLTNKATDEFYGGMSFYDFTTNASKLKKGSTTVYVNDPRAK